MGKVAIYVRESSHNDAEAAACKQAEKLKGYCEKNGYTVCNSAVVVGDRKTANPIFMDLLKSAKEKDVAKIVMASSNRIVGTVDELIEIKKAIEKAGVTIETLDRSYENGFDEKMLVASFLANVQKEMDEYDALV